MSDPQQPHGLEPSRLLCPWDFPGRSTRVGCHCLLRALHKSKTLVDWIMRFIKAGDSDKLIVRKTLLNQTLPSQLVYS